MNNYALHKSQNLQRALFFLALAFHCNVSNATLWLEYWRNSVGDSYYDPLTIRTIDGEIEVDVLTDLNGTAVRPNGTKYLSMTGLERYDCENNTYSYVSLQIWESPRGTGKLIRTTEYSAIEKMRVDPETAAGKLFTILCKKTASYR